MTRYRHEGFEEANIWPAVTDSILLMASIFILLTITTLLFFVGRYRERHTGEGAQGEQLMALTYHIPEGILFTTGHAGLKPESVKVISAILEDVPKQLPALRNYARQQEWGTWYIVLEASGHTDYVPVRGSSEDANWDLSTQRSDSVMHLIERIFDSRTALRRDVGIAMDSFGSASEGSTVLRAAGYSSHLPEADYPNPAIPGPVLEAAKSKNRRVEIRLFAEPGKVLKNSPPSRTP